MDYRVTQVDGVELRTPRWYDNNAVNWLTTSHGCQSTNLVREDGLLHKRSTSKWHDRTSLKLRINTWVVLIWSICRFHYVEYIFVQKNFTWRSFFILLIYRSLIFGCYIFVIAHNFNYTRTKFVYYCSFKWKLMKLYWNQWFLQVQLN